MTDKNTGKSRGFGFITFENEDAVDFAVAKYFENKIDEKWVECKKAFPRDFNSPPLGSPGPSSVISPTSASSSKPNLFKLPSNNLLNLINQSGQERRSSISSSSDTSGSEDYDESPTSTQPSYTTRQSYNPDEPNQGFWENNQQSGSPLKAKSSINQQEFLKKFPQFNKDLLAHTNQMRFQKSMQNQSYFVNYNRQTDPMRRSSLNTATRDHFGNIQSVNIDQMGGMDQVAINKAMMIHALQQRMNTNQRVGGTNSAKDGRRTSMMNLGTGLSQFGQAHQNYQGKPMTPGKDVRRGSMMNLGTNQFNVMNTTNSMSQVSLGGIGQRRLSHLSEKSQTSHGGSLNQLGMMNGRRESLNYINQNKQGSQNFIPNQSGSRTSLRIQNQEDDLDQKDDVLKNTFFPGIEMVSPTNNRRQDPRSPELPPGLIMDNDSIDHNEIFFGSRNDLSQSPVVNNPLQIRQSSYHSPYHSPHHNLMSPQDNWSNIQSNVGTEPKDNLNNQYFCQHQIFPQNLNQDQSTSPKKGPEKYIPLY